MVNNGHERGESTPPFYTQFLDGDKISGINQIVVKVE